MNFENQIRVKYVKPGFAEWLASTGYHKRTLAQLDKIIARAERRARKKATKQRIGRGVSI